MAGNDGDLRAYEELADRYDRQKEARQRDVFLVLAADAALAAGRRDQAERLRARLLQANPHHLFRPYSSFAEGLQSADVRLYVADLKRQYPPEVAQRLLKALREKEQDAALAAQQAKAAESAADDAGLKVYRLQGDAEAGAAPPVRQHLSRPPVRMGPLPTESGHSRTPPSRPAERNAPYDPGPEPAGRTGREETEEGARAGAWVCFLLFLVVLGLSLAWAFLLFVGPLFF